MKLLIDYYRYKLFGIRCAESNRSWVLRNYFVCPQSMGDVYKGMVELGYLTVGYKSDEDGILIYHATREGCKALGLNDLAIEDAMNHSRRVSWN